MLCRAPQSSASALCHLQGGVGPPPPSGASLNRSPAPNAQPSLFNGAQRLLPLLPLGMRLGSDVDVGRSLRIEPLVLNGIKSDRSGNGPKNMPILRSRRKGGRSKSMNPGTSTGRRREPQPRRRRRPLSLREAASSLPKLCPNTCWPCQSFRKHLFRSNPIFCRMRTPREVLLILDRAPSVRGSMSMWV